MSIEDQIQKLREDAVHNTSVRVAQALIAFFDKANISPVEAIPALAITLGCILELLPKEDQDEVLIRVTLTVRETIRELSK